MMRVRLLTLLILLFIGHLPVSAKQSPKITIAAAANLVPAIDSLIKDFTRDHPIAIDLVSGSSGQLAAQIRNGAPYDLFLSADLFFPQSLIDSGHARDSVVIYARGQLVFCAVNNDKPDKLLRELNLHKNIRLTIANPRLAPYGAQSLEVLRRVGLDKERFEDIVNARNISQVNQFLQTAVVDAGITAFSAIRTNNWPNTLYWVLIEPDLYEPIYQGAVVTTFATGQNQQIAVQFLQFVKTEAGARRLRQFGYLEP